MKEEVSLHNFEIRMSETCKNCRQKFDSGIWLAPQFDNEKVLLFCSAKCEKRYIQMKLQRIKNKYPDYYKKIMKSSKDRKHDAFWIKGK